MTHTHTHTHTHTERERERERELSKASDRTTAAVCSRYERLLLAVCVYMCVRQSATDAIQFQRHPSPN